MSTLIELRDIHVAYNDKNVLEKIDLTLKSGEITTLLGPNGAGKSTLVKVVLGLVKPSSGTINYYDASESRQTTSNNLRIGYVPQSLILNETLPLTVDRFLRLTGKTSTQDRIDALALVGATHLQNNNMHKLSGGEKQRVLLARAVLQKPDLLVLDEPAQGVDVQGQMELYQLIQHIKAKFNCAIFMVSHDLHLVMAQTDHVICLQHHICCSGAPEAISQDPSYLAMFGLTKYEDDAKETLAVYQHQHKHQHNLSGGIVDDDTNFTDNEIGNKASPCCDSHSHSQDK